MHARFLRFSASPDKRKAIEALTDKVYALAQTLPGFISATYAATEDCVNYASVTIWTDRESADEAATVLGREFGMALADVASDDVSLNLMEVYEPVG